MPSRKKFPEKWKIGVDMWTIEISLVYILYFYIILTWKYDLLGNKIRSEQEIYWEKTSRNFLFKCMIRNDNWFGKSWSPNDGFQDGWGGTYSPLWLCIHDVCDHDCDREWNLTACASTAEIDLIWLPCGCCCCGSLLWLWLLCAVVRVVCEFVERIPKAIYWLLKHTHTQRHSSCVCLLSTRRVIFRWEMTHNSTVAIDPFASTF